MKHFFSQLGFTMIELLVVISVIGVLAVAVLSSINPIEQINKGRDTRTRSDSAQMINGVDRFYATQELYPWNDNNHACGTGTPCAPATVSDPDAGFPTDAGFANAGVCTPIAAGSTGEGMCLLDNTGGAWMDALVATNEVKAGFVSRIAGLGDAGDYAIYVYKGAQASGANDTMYACFEPSSLAFKNEALLVCSDTGKGEGIYASWPTVVQAAACPGTNPGATNYVPSATDEHELICLP